MRALAVVGTLAALALLAIACTTSPLGRKQLILLPDSQVDQAGVAAYDQLKSSTAVSRNVAANRYVNCIADAIVAQLAPAQRTGWEVNVFADDSANAFALPGRKIGVHTGLLAVATNADQLAAVIGHEVGHVLARHGNERVSLQVATQTGLGIAQVLAQSRGTAEQRQLFALLGGVGTQVGVILPFSRRHETEADVIGLELMAKAGFDPRQSVALWRNMRTASGGNQPPEFLSTHPAHDTRIADLTAAIPTALPWYEQQSNPPNCRPYTP